MKNSTMRERVSAMRRLRDMSQNALAKKSNLSRSAISQFERGIHRLNAENIGEIARVLGTSTDYLIYGTEDNRAHSMCVELFKALLENRQLQQVIAAMENEKINRLMQQVQDYLDRSE